MIVSRSARARARPRGRPSAPGARRRRPGSARRAGRGGDVDRDARRAARPRAMRARCAAAWSSTSSVSSRTSPERSTSGTNSAGGRGRARGAPSARGPPRRDRAGAQAGLGLEVQASSPPVIAARSSAASASRSRLWPSRSRRVDLDPVAVGLGLVHRDVGVAQQLFASSRVLGVPRDADARPDVQQQVVERERLSSASRRRRATARPSARSLRVASTTRELVAAEPAERAVVAQRRAAAAGRPRSASSPAWWPSVSLSSLKRSRSIMSSATAPAGRDSASSSA